MKPDAAVFLPLRYSPSSYAQDAQQETHMLPFENGSAAMLLFHGYMNFNVLDPLRNHVSPKPGRDECMTDFAVRAQNRTSVFKKRLRTRHYLVSLA